jgi:lipopolysaccharide export system protein LptA
MRDAPLHVWFNEDATNDDDRIRRVVAEQRVALALNDGRRVFTDRLELDALARTAELSGENVVLVDEGHVIDKAQLVTIDEALEIYTLAGGGRFRRFEQPALDASVERLDPEHLRPLAARAPTLAVTWRMQVRIAPTDDPQPHRQAEFTGDVTVSSPEMRLTHADLLRVAFDTRGEGDDTEEVVRSIDARGDVHVVSAGDPGEITCASLHVDLETDASGRAVPTRLHAAGPVRIADPRQTMWSDTLDVTFLPVDEDAAAVAGAGDDEHAFASARVAVDEVRADGDVQVRLAGGEHAFADRLRADGAREIAHLEGDRVLVVAGTRVLDRGRRLTLEKQTGRYRVEGSGEFYELRRDTDLVTARDRRVRRPDVTGERSVEAAWRDAAEYVETASGGTLTIRGTVHAESRPSATELNVLDADTLALDFTPRAAEAEASAEADDDDATNTNLELARLVATGSARMENRTWTPDGSDLPPRVYYVAGDRIEYDQRTLEAHVPGRGELLIRNPWPETEAETETAPFATRGVTLLRWREALNMTRVVDERYRIDLTGGVECVHQDLDGETSTLTGHQLEASVMRGRARAEHRGDAPSGALRFGGSMELRRIMGQGGLTIRTPQRDVAADRFDYDLTTGMAEASAAPGRMVSVLTRGHPEPMQHGHIEWDMRRDTISVTRGSATASP